MIRILFCLEDAFALGGIQTAVSTLRKLLEQRGYAANVCSVGHREDFPNWGREWHRIDSVAVDSMVTYPSYRAAGALGHYDVFVATSPRVLLLLLCHCNIQPRQIVLHYHGFSEYAKTCYH